MRKKTFFHILFNLLLLRIGYNDAAGAAELRRRGGRTRPQWHAQAARWASQG